MTKLISRNNQAGFRNLLMAVALVMTTSAFAPVTDEFTPAEQQQISIATPGLFECSNTFSVDFATLPAADYSFPLPVGKAKLAAGHSALVIKTTKGDAVKAMFEGVVRLSKKHDAAGNVIVIRHPNGLETVYEHNTQNLAKVGQRVKAGETIAIVGTDGDEGRCTFYIMVNGARVNPATLIDPKSHRLRRQTIQCRKNGNRVAVSVVAGEGAEEELSLDPSAVTDDPFAGKGTFRLDLSKIGAAHWAYPLPGSHVISPYGGRRHHSGVDVKTRPNDRILAAFDGVVTLSGPHYGYGNCVRIRHAYGFETLYSHQSRNLVKAGQKVKAGQVIGLTGRTGRATTEHLHFEVHFKGRRHNPNVLFDHAARRLRNVTLVLSRNGNIRSEKN